MSPSSVQPALQPPPTLKRSQSTQDEDTLRPTVLKSQSLFFPDDPAFNQTHPPSLAARAAAANTLAEVKKEDLSQEPKGETSDEGGGQFKRSARSSRKSKAQAMVNMDAQSAALRASLQAELAAGHAVDLKQLPYEPPSAAKCAPGASDPDPLPTSSGPGPHLNPARQAAAQPRPAALDFTTVSLTMPQDFPQRTHQRCFDLPHCPVFRPTPAEFAKPLEYIEKVSREVMGQHGILKVVPPLGWKPPFSLDSQVRERACIGQDHFGSS